MTNDGGKETFHPRGNLLRKHETVLWIGGTLFGEDVIRHVTRIGKG